MDLKACRTAQKKTGRSPNHTYVPRFAHQGTPAVLLYLLSTTVAHGAVTRLLSVVFVLLVARSSGIVFSGHGQLGVCARLSVRVRQGCQALATFIAAKNIPH